MPDWALAIAQKRLSRRRLQAAKAAVAEAAAMRELDGTAYAGTIASLRGPTLTRMG